MYILISYFFLLKEVAKEIPLKTLLLLVCIVFRAVAHRPFRVELNSSTRS